MILPPSTELRASLSGCHAKIPEASPASIREIISANTGLPGTLAVCFSTKVSTTSSCSFLASSHSSESWSASDLTCRSSVSVDLRVYMKNFLDEVVMLTISIARFREVKKYFSPHSVEKRSTFASLTDSCSRPADVGTAEAPHGRPKAKVEGARAVRTSDVACHRLYGSGSGPLRTL